MGTTDSIALVSAIAAWMGVIVTGVFSFLVWKATKETANVAKSNYLLAEQIDNRLREMKTNAKEIYFKSILQNAHSMLIFLNRPNNGTRLKLEDYEKLQKNPGISSEKIAEYFDKEEKDSILNLWNMFDTYIKDYWTDENGTVAQLSSERGIRDAEIAASKLSQEILDFAVKYRMYHDGE